MAIAITWIGFVSIWLAVSVSAERSAMVTRDECDFCRSAFAGCHCEGTTDDYEIICNKNAHDFWSLGFCSARSIKLIWDRPEQPEALTAFPELPILHNLHLVGLPEISLNMSRLENLEQLTIENPATTNFPVLFYPAKLQNLAISSEEELWFPSESFTSLKTLSSLTLRGNGFKRFPIKAVSTWVTSNSNGNRILSCSVADTQMPFVPCIEGKFNVQADVPVKNLWWWNILPFVRNMYLDQLEGTPNSFRADKSAIPETPKAKNALPISFGVDGSHPLPDDTDDISSSVGSDRGVSTASSSPTQTSQHNENPAISSQMVSECMQETGTTMTGTCPVRHEGVHSDTECRQAEFQTKADSTTDTNVVQAGASCLEPQNPSDPHGLQTQMELQTQSDSSRDLISNQDNPARFPVQISHQYRNDDPSSLECSDKFAVPAESDFANRIQELSADPSCLQSYGDRNMVYPEFGLKENEDELSATSSVSRQSGSTRNEPCFSDSDGPEAVERRSQSEPHGNQFSGDDLPKASRTAFVNINGDNIVDLSAESNQETRCQGIENSCDDHCNSSKSDYESIVTESELSANKAASPPIHDAIDSLHQSDYEISSTNPDKTAHQIGPQASISSSKGSDNTPLIIAVTFVTCGFMFAVIIFCIRHRPGKSLVVPSSVDEDWIRTQTEPGNGD